MNQKLANATGLYLDGIRDGNVRQAVEKYTGDRYTQHSTGVADGVEGFVAFFEPFVERNPFRDIRIIRSIVDGDNVFVHAYQDINNGEAKWVTTDLFDTDDDDKVIEHWDVIAPYHDGAVDGPTEVTDLDRTEDNRALVRAHLGEQPGVTIRQLVCQGCFAAALLEMDLDGVPSCVVDVFHLADGAITRTWRNAEPIPEGPQPNSGKF